ncbi:MAG: hypothetical protein WD844_08045 [Thermoleophilaceae bacterium]
MPIPLAHAGHWLVQLVYFLPVIAFLVWLGISQVKARREGDGEDSGNSPEVR